MIGQAVHRLKVADQGTAQRTEIHALVGNRSKTQEHSIAPRAGEVAGAEVRPVGLDDVLVPVEQVQQLGAQVLRQLQIEHRHLIRQQRLLELRPGHLQRRHVEVVDLVEAARNIGALAPVHDLPAEAHLRGHGAEIEAPEPKRIQQARVAAGHALGVMGQLNVIGGGVHDLEIVEAGATQEDSALLLVVERDLADAR